MTAPLAVLVRHFISASLAPEVLTEVGRDYLRRLVFGLLAILLVLGWILPRVFFHKYTELGALVGNVAYLRAVQADTLFMIAVPMLLIGLATVIAGPMLFPDETDYRVLTPLPISRAMLFGAKLIAVVAIVSTAIVAVNAVATFWFPIAISGRKAQHALIERVIAHVIGATSGSLFMCLAVMALQGLTIVAVPRAWRRQTSVVIQASICVALLLSMPLVSRMPGMNVTEATVMQMPLGWLPPAWFLGLERWWLDGEASGQYAIAARVAAIVTLAALAIVIACYAMLFRSAEQLAGVAGSDRRTTSKAGRVARWLSALTAPQTVAIIEFVGAGLSRSRLHQFVFLLALGGGVALFIGQVATAMEGVTPLASRPRAPIQAAISAPLIVALTFMLGLRAAYRWPLDRGAAWIFRVTEDPRTRTRTLNGAAYCVSIGGWLSALATVLALQPPVLGASWLVSAILTSLAVGMLAEFLLLEWSRVPYACSYLPGTRVLAYHLGVLFAQYFVVVVIGGNLIRWAVLAPARTLALGGMFMAAWAALRRERWKTWGLLPLEFEDDDPAEVRGLKL